MENRHSSARAVLARDAALRRLRRLTGGAIAVAVALSGVFAGVAAGSTHTKKAVPAGQREVRSARATTPPLPPAPSAPRLCGGAAPRIRSARADGAARRRPRWIVTATLASHLPALGTTAVVVTVGPRCARHRVRRPRGRARRDRPRVQPLPADSELARVNAAAGEEVRSGRCCSTRCGSRSARPRRARGSSTPRSAGRCASPATTRRSRSSAAATARTCDRRSSAIRAGARSSSTSDARTVRTPRGVELDLGATAKALAADRAAPRRRATESGVLVSLGGDIAVAGEPPPGGWSIRIADDNAAPLDAPDRP